jgi:deoxyribonuclease V
VVAGGWPTGHAELEAVQRELSRQREDEPPWRPGPTIRAGGVFAVPRKGLAGHGAPGDEAWVGAVVHDQARVLDSVVVAGTLMASYSPGYLALRQGPLLEQAVRALRLRPDVLLVNATGLDHPRGAGLAVHLGAVLDLPTIGVTERTLTDVTEGRARAVTTRPGRRPLVVHPGWRTDLDTAIAVVETLSRDARTPAPLREARRLARTARARSA